MANGTPKIEVTLSTETKRILNRLVLAVESLEKFKGHYDVFGDATPEGISQILNALPDRTVIAGPEWHDEVYQKSGETWYGIGSGMPWEAKDLGPRGPFNVLRRGGSGR